MKVNRYGQAKILTGEEINQLFEIGHPDSAALILREAFAELAIAGSSTHSFRRTALTRLSKAGVPSRAIQEISGHETLSVLQKYLEGTEQQVVDAIASL